MKLVTFEKAGGGKRLGAFVSGGQDVVDIQASHSILSGTPHAALISTLALIEGGDEAFALAMRAIESAPVEAVVSRSSVEIHAPIQPPPQFRDCLCFEEHLQEAFKQARKVRAQAFADPEAAMKEMEEKNILGIPQTFYEQPIYYKANRFAVIGTDHDVRWPHYSKIMDFELEFGCYIRKKALDVKKENARDYIFGYTIFNDMSARDAQTKEMPGQLGPGKGKDFDTGNPMGPCLVTYDEIPDPYNLTMIARVNGEEWTRNSTSTMMWKFEDLIEHISRSETLYPGEFLGSGTVGGGCGLEKGRFLNPGDVIELEVEGIGILRNRIVGTPAL
jgi:2-keto-4-pentenoate hydratase/2-oxohepta-3-ene-1,7-dioic acid hydratase in catechol pathway